MFTEDSAVFVDADSLFFKICYVTQNKAEIKKLLKNWLANIRRDCMTDMMLIAVRGEMDGEPNFRKVLDPTYKANRKPIEPEIYEALNYAHRILVDHYGAIPANGMEADDLISIWAQEALELKQEYIIAGIDKDLLQIEGVHYNYDKGQRHFQTISQDKGNYNLMLQCLTGDTADNVPGIKGIGPAKGTAILRDVPQSQRWSKICEAFTEHDAGDPTHTWRLLSLLQSFDEYYEILDGIDAKNKTLLRKQHVHEEQTQVDTVQELPDGDKGRTEGAHGLAPRESTDII